MSSKVPYTTCTETGKVRYANEHDAKKALGKAKSLRPHRRGVRTESRHYECEHCGGWHLSSMSRRQFLAHNEGAS